MKHKISILAVFLLVLCVNVVTAQLYEVSLDQKLQESTLIIEGKVIKSKAFRGHDGHVYTAHDIQAFSVLKGSLQDLQDQKITVITYGGTLDEEAETWTHLLTLSKNDVGVFFLTATNRPIPNKNKAFYEVYSSSQGFLKYTENDFQEVVAIAPFNYHQKNNLLQNIRQSTGQFKPVFANDDESPEDVTGVEYSIKNVSLSGNVLDFDIYVEGLWGSYDLTESELLIEYDPTVLGQNVNSNGVLSISPGVVSSSPNYSLSVNDVNPDKVSINIKALNTGFALYTVSNIAEQLVHIQIASPASGNPDIEFDEAAMQQLSEYLDANSGIEVFQQVFAVGKIEDISGGNMLFPNITDFYPDTISAGTGDTLTIIGTDFGVTRGASRIKLRNASQGPNSTITWVTCTDSNYVYWSDDTIKIIVAAGGFEDNNIASVSNAIFPGTGKIRIMKGNTNLNFSTSNDDLFIPYCVSNAVSVQNTLISFLGNRNGIGGYDLYYSGEFRRDTLARETFERALKSWRCQTLVNFRIVDSTEVNTNNSCKIEYDSLPIGTTTTTLASTLPSPSNCVDTSFTPTRLVYRYSKSFSIKFNSQLLWHRQQTMPTILPNNTYDLESRSLHELGHAHLLNHSNNPNDLMYFTDLTPPYRRMIEPNDLDGGNHVCTFSSNLNTSNYLQCSSPMILIDSSDCDSVVTTLFIDTQRSIDVSIFPNPSNEVIFIKFKEDYRTIKNIKIHSLSGQLMIQDDGIVTDTSIDISSLQNGMYILTIQAENSIQSFKIIKTN